jgi:hypothetical protein
MCGRASTNRVDVGRQGAKQKMYDFWQARPCGEIYASGQSRREQLEEHSRQRYTLEPYIPAFARFEEGSGNDVLEIGVGMGADHTWSGLSTIRATWLGSTLRRKQSSSRKSGCAVLVSDPRSALPMPSICRLRMPRLTLCILGECSTTRPTPRVQFVTSDEFCVPAAARAS